MNERLDRIQGYYREYHRLVLKTARMYVGQEAAEDLVQDVFLELQEDLDGISEDKIKTWLLVVTKHKALNYLKKSCNVCEVSLEVTVLQEEDKFSQASAEEVVMDQLRKKDMQRICLHALDKLSQKNLQWFDLIFETVWLNRKAKDVAKKQGTNANNINVMKKRAKNYLRKEMEEEWRNLN